MPKKGPRIFKQKQQLVNVYQNEENIPWLELFKKIQEGSTFISVNTTTRIPESTIKSCYYKWKKDPMNGIKDRHFSGFHKKFNQHLSPEEEMILEKRIITLRKKGYQISRCAILREGCFLFPHLKEKLNIHWAGNFANRHQFVQRKGTKIQKPVTLSKWKKRAETFRDECATIVQKYDLASKDVFNFDETRIVLGNYFKI